MRMKQQGAADVKVFVVGSSWYGAKPDVQFGPSAKLFPVGNDFYGSAPASEGAADPSFFTMTPAPGTLAQLSRALDDLRHLGELDLRLNHPSAIW